MTRLSVTFEEISGRKMQEDLRRPGDSITVNVDGRAAMTIHRQSRRRIRIEMHTPFAGIDDATLRAWAAKRWPA